MKILIADDCPTTRRVLRKNLQSWGYETLLAEGGHEAVELVCGADPPRLILLDWVMPDLEGPVVCRILRDADLTLYPYIIFLTANRSSEAAVEALEAGADDFLRKPVETEELRQRIRAGQRIIDLQDKLLATQAQLRRLARQDALTGILNRGAITESLLEACNRIVSAKQIASLALIDLDHFKRINDTHGHPAGDYVLREAARRMRSVLQDGHELGRFGGEEFAVVMPGEDIDTAIDAAEALRQAVARQGFLFDGVEIKVTASIGVAGGPTSDFDSDSLTKAADRALYAAKSAGRNCVRIANPQGNIFSEV
ncbi:MAG: diguanylate cyclase [Planctomycetales bacterium]|nr:diguanylate cyclase [Planctomycetales bacterium]